MSQNIIEYPSLGTPPSGSIRFNTDSAKMEIYNGEQWWEIDSTSPDEQTGGTRGLIFGGEGSNPRNTIQFFNVDSTGNAIDFGDIVGDNRRDGVGTSSPTRGVFSCGYDGSSFHDEQDSVELLTLGNAVDFGDTVNGNRFRLSGGSSGHGGL